MNAKIYTLRFTGFELSRNIDCLLKSSGIYCVYACKYNVHNNIFSPLRLLYIGESETVSARIAEHERREDWERELRNGEELCFSAAPIDSISNQELEQNSRSGLSSIGAVSVNSNSDRKRAEAAMIYSHKPPCNVEYTNSFPFGNTTIRIEGESSLLKPIFSVNLATGGLESIAL